MPNPNSLSSIAHYLFHVFKSQLKSHRFTSLVIIIFTLAHSLQICKQILLISAVIDTVYIL